MKIARLTTNYPSYVKAFYAKHPALADKPYVEQHKAVMYDAFGWADFLTHGLKKLGHETFELIGNIEPMQKAWAREKGVKYDERNWLLDIVKAQLLSFQPEVLMLTDHHTYGARWINEVRESCPSIRLVVGWCGAPFSDPSVFKAYDIVLSDTQELIEQFLAMGHRSRRMFHGFDPRILERIDTSSPPTEDFTFIGSIARGSTYHLERERALISLVRQVGIKIYTPGADSPIRPKDYVAIPSYQVLFAAVQKLKKHGVPGEWLARIPKIGKVAGWPDPPIFPINLRLKSHARGAVYGLDMFQALRRSKATFNRHIDISPRTANNNRLFEATGVGTVLVTDWKENLHELFELDTEVVVYRSIEECVEKVRWLLRNPKEREKIAQAGQKRALRDHSWESRARQFDALVKELL